MLHKTLKENRYLANEVCWVFSVEGVETYILFPRDSSLLDQFIEAVKPSQRGTDTDVVIGTRGPMAPAEMCNGLVLPLVLVDRWYSFDRPALTGAIKKPRISKWQRKRFGPLPMSSSICIQQITDNVGGTDEHRAVNYLAWTILRFTPRQRRCSGRTFAHRYSGQPLTALGVPESW